MQADEASVGGLSLAEEVLEYFPFGILVTRRSGELVEWNRASRELLGDVDTGFPPTCCALLGCGRADGPLEETCLSQLAVEAAERLPEIRVDLPPDSPTSAVWVTAAPLDAAGQRVVMHIRPGEPGDRRRRTEPHWISGSELHIRVLGPTTVESREGSLGGDWLGQRSGQLLKYFVCERHRLVQPEEIAESIWPGVGPKALSNVRYTVHCLRERLEPERPKRAESSFIAARHGGYELDLAHVDIDADRFEVCVQAGLSSFDGGAHAISAEQLERAVELYRGDFLADDPYAEWAFGERNRLRELAGEALRTLAEIRLCAGELDAPAQYMERLAQMEPLDVYVHRQLFTLWLRAGRRSQAVRGYSALRIRMFRELGEELDFELSQLRAEASRPLRLK